MHHDIQPADMLSPADRYRELFVDIQTARIFSDSKSFVDCAPRGDPEQILAAYRAEKSVAGFDLAAFVHAHFDLQIVPPSHYISDPDKSLPDHIDDLWPVLTRHPHQHPPFSSLLPLPNPYVVPGGRFGELYYWDSYFTMLGLAASGRQDLLHAMADNFAYLIDTYGRIPNGTRTYYLSRSQPPLFALMVELFESEGVRDALHYLPQLRKEYDFWMDGAASLAPGQAHRRVVRLPDGALLNRYWDERETPREESFIEDLETARAGERPAPQVYRDLRAAAESGWDFSSRWLATENALHSIRTTAILPVDLNSFLYKLETTIADLSAADRGENRVSGLAETFRQKAATRKTAMSRHMWNEQSGAFFDFDWALAAMRRNLTVATVAPLFVQLASPAQAERVAATLGARLLKEGGVATTETESGQQWDEPNGWASMQWLAIRGLEHYGKHELAAEIAHRWLTLVANLYTRESKLVEKYALYKSPEAPGVALGGRGGEYPLQDGFGWTNGVTRKLLQLYPQHAAAGSRAATKKA
ncbi:alpha,alpha-trehalase TreF [Oxalobacteraceae bacterium CAVE-383]|nr:alpha,alpha-trehalase TreF [Oxalobacteraceae bacterium CAVE-383]